MPSWLPCQPNHLTANSTWTSTASNTHRLTTKTMLANSPPATIIAYKAILYYTWIQCSFAFPVESILKLSFYVKMLECKVVCMFASWIIFHACVKFVLFNINCVACLFIHLEFILNFIFCTKINLFPKFIKIAYIDWDIVCATQVTVR